MHSCSSTLSSITVARTNALHAFVIMPEHLHVIISPTETLERAIQCIKGGFSYRYNQGRAVKADIWQRGYADHHIRDANDFSYSQNLSGEQPCRTQAMPVSL